MVDKDMEVRLRLERAEQRAAKLAREKSFLQITIRMMNAIGAVTGLEHLVESVLKNLVEVIGGQGAALYYFIDNGIFYADLDGSKTKLDRIDDPLVRHAIESRQPAQRVHDFADTGMLTPEFTKAYTWALPLLVGTELIGVLEMKSLHMSREELDPQISTLFSYVSLVLKNEILGASRLRQLVDELGESNAQLTNEVEERRRVEDELREAERKYRGIFDNAIVGIFQSAPDGRLLSVNPSLATALGYDSPEEMTASVCDMPRQVCVEAKRHEEFKLLMDTHGRVQNFECEVFRKDGSKIWLTMSVSAVRQNGAVFHYEGMCEDITEHNLLRARLLQAQKLESVGQLAAGIAHEINTPAQYIGDNVRFLDGAFQDLKSLLASYEQLLSAAQESNISRGIIQDAAAAAARADIGFLVEEIPRAIEQTLEGVAKVSALVSAMKEFSQPGTKEKVLLDLNHAIESTITVARNEWKYVADLQTELDESLPLIPCQPGEFNQVILNLIVNAAHAIADAVRDRGSEKGLLSRICGWFLVPVIFQVCDTLPFPSL